MAGCATPVSAVAGQRSRRAAPSATPQRRSRACAWQLAAHIAPTPWTPLAAIVAGVAVCMRPERTCARSSLSRFAARHRGSAPSAMWQPADVLVCSCCRHLYATRRARRGDRLGDVPPAHTRQGRAPSGEPAKASSIPPQQRVAASSRAEPTQNTTARPSVPWPRTRRAAASMNLESVRADGHSFRA